MSMLDKKQVSRIRDLLKTPISPKQFQFIRGEIVASHNDLEDIWKALHSNMEAQCPFKVGEAVWLTIRIKHGKLTQRMAYVHAIDIHDDGNYSLSYSVADASGAKTNLKFDGFTEEWEGIDAAHPIKEALNPHWVHSIAYTVTPPIEKPSAIATKRLLYAGIACTVYSTSRDTFYCDLEGVRENGTIISLPMIPSTYGVSTEEEAMQDGRKAIHDHLVKCMGPRI